MKRILCVAILVVLGLGSYSMGAVWVIEIEYRLNGGELLTGFIDASYITNSFENTKDDSDLLLTELNNRFGKNDSLPIYDLIIDHEILAKTASFPMHPYHLFEGSVNFQSVNSIAQVNLIKVWTKNEYWIDVLTRLDNMDTTWVGREGNIDYPLSQDVGCRLEVHNLGSFDINQKLMDEFLVIYKMDIPRSHQNQGRFHKILGEMKKDKIVLVELCGC